MDKCPPFGVLFVFFLYICNFWLLSISVFSSEISFRSSLTFYLEFDKGRFLVSRRNSNGVYFSQVIRFVRVCIYITDFNARNKNLTAEPLKHVFGMMNFYNVSKNIRRHFELVSKHRVDLKLFLHHGLLEAAFYGNNTI